MAPKVLLSVLMLVISLWVYQAYNTQQIPPTPSAPKADMAEPVPAAPSEAPAEAAQQYTPQYAATEDESVQPSAPETATPPPPPPPPPTEAPAAADESQPDAVKNSYRYCSCTADDVDEGAQDVLETLNRITTQPYFRYFKVNSEKPCPYWVVSLLCTSAENTCEVCTCDENSIPAALRENEDMSDFSIPESGLANGVSVPKNVDEWGLWRHEEEDGAVYVDLVKNPEGNTGYSGPLAGKVWQAIYNENCLSSGTEETCSEVNVLRTLLSGLHTSINIHVCTNFYKDPDHQSPQMHAGIYNNPDISFFPNCDMYRKRVAPYKEFLGNLYVLYQFTLRALTKAKPLFLDNLDAFNAGADGVASEEDMRLHADLRELFENKLLCVKTFDETAFLESPKGRGLVPQMKAMMLNVSRLMDCVTCQKCRIWGKLETKGIATAMKIIMHDDNEPLVIDRAEKVTLINLARQLSFSVRNTQLLAVACREEPAAEPPAE